MSGTDQFHSAGKVGKDLVTDYQSQCLYIVYAFIALCIKSWLLIRLLFGVVSCHLFIFNDELKRARKGIDTSIY